jgi:hypothetical protein
MKNLLWRPIVFGFIGLLEHGKGIEFILDSENSDHFFFEKDIAQCRIEADFIVYNNQTKEHLHFAFVEKNIVGTETSRVTAPVTVFSELKTPKKYTEGQLPLIVINKEKKYNKLD